MNNSNERKRLFTWVSNDTRNAIKAKAAINNMTMEKYVSSLIESHLDESKDISDGKTQISDFFATQKGGDSGNYFKS